MIHGPWKQTKKRYEELTSFYTVTDVEPSYPMGLSCYSCVSICGQSRAQHCYLPLVSAVSPHKSCLEIFVEVKWSLPQTASFSLVCNWNIQHGIKADLSWGYHRSMVWNGLRSWGNIPEDIQGWHRTVWFSSLVICSTVRDIIPEFSTNLPALILAWLFARWKTFPSILNFFDRKPGLSRWIRWVPMVIR